MYYNKCITTNFIFLDIYFFLKGNDLRADTTST